MKIGQGGGVVGSAQITDGAIVDADVNAAAAIAQSKIAASLNGNTDLITTEVGLTDTLSVTTVAGQRLIVLANFNLTGGAGACTCDLKYGGVTKKTINAMNNATQTGSFMEYTEIPGAGTANIQIVPSAGSVTNATILVIKLRSA
jgi:hypothetical protein